MTQHPDEPTNTEASVLVELLARVDAAEGAHRYVDCWLACALDGFFPTLAEWPARDGTRWRVNFCCLNDGGGISSPGHGGDQMVPLYTASLDAALALCERVLPGWCIATIGQQDGGSWWVELREGHRTSYNRVADSDARIAFKAPALALVAAMLKAKIAQAASPADRAG